VGGDIAADGISQDSGRAGVKGQFVAFYPHEWLISTLGLDNAERGLLVTAYALMWAAGRAIGKEHLREACRKDHGHAFNRQLARLIKAGHLTENERGEITNKQEIKRRQMVRKPPIKGQQIKAEDNYINEIPGVVNLRNAIGSSPLDVPPPSSPSDSPNNYPLFNPPISPSTRTLRVIVSKFEEFWLECPRKVGKAAAAKAYAKALHQVSHDELVSAMRIYSAGRNGQDPQFTVHPTTWLNQGRWADETSGSNHGHAQPAGPKPSLQEILGDDYERAMGLAH
jgi:hypothetical protein